jgi:hypothetical protein
VSLTAAAAKIQLLTIFIWELSNPLLFKLNSIGNVQECDAREADKRCKACYKKISQYFVSISISMFFYVAPVL